MIFTKRDIRIWSLLASLMVLGFCSRGQQPDFYLQTLAPAMQTRSLAPDVPDASISLYSDGLALSLYIEVYDPHVVVNPGDEISDRMELWFGLAPEAGKQTPDGPSPQNFLVYRSPGDDDIRFFGVLPEEKDQPGITPVFDAYGYPGDVQIRQEKMYVPSRAALHEERMDFGLVGIGLFPDGRIPVVLNRESLHPLESALGKSLGELEAGVSYSVDPMEDGRGYIINAQFKLPALGFVRTPVCQEIWFGAELADLRGSGDRQRLFRDSGFRQTVMPKMHRVQLRHPLSAELLEGLPGSTQEQLAWFPVCVFTEDGWEVVEQHSGALVFKEWMASPHYTETCYRQVEIERHEETHGGRTIDLISSHHRPVNNLPYRWDHIGIAGHWYSFQTLDREEVKAPLYFQFEDKTPGLILTEYKSLDPFGWGDCPDCVEQILRILRLGAQGFEEVLSVHYVGGPEGYCAIGDEGLQLEGYRLSQWDWVREGQIMVFRLDHQYSKAKKRIKVSWADDGSDVEVVLVN